MNNPENLQKTWKTDEKVGKNVIEYRIQRKRNDGKTMSKKVSAIRFEPEEKEWIESFAELNGKSFSAQVREWTLERLEDELDARDLKEVMAKDDGERYQLSDVLAELGL